MVISIFLFIGFIAWMGIGLAFLVISETECDSSFEALFAAFIWPYHAMNLLLKQIVKKP